ncbi:uncharacterized protein LOC26534555 [Drosophila yakuba]|uniref:Secreted protein n=1 Tax=Drosophila yakuba TaxID=7245 RepID=A0A0R1DZ92_DROYA|nr:uncharacterized protein LOC26534555 [Drosophila yakuba]KRK00657.1 uncharacterized protein Dyak_GE27374 [Drosophila yakuba]
MKATYQLVVISAIIFGHLQFQPMVLASSVYRRPNAVAFAPARTYGGGFNHSAVNSGHKNYTKAIQTTNWTAPAVHQPVLQAPGFISPPQNRSWARANQGPFGAPAQGTGIPSGWVASNNHQQGVPGFFQLNQTSQVRIGTPAFVVGKNNGTLYQTYNATVHNRTYPYGNLSV